MFVVIILYSLACGYDRKEEEEEVADVDSRLLVFLWLHENCVRSKTSRLDRQLASDEKFWEREQRMSLIWECLLISTRSFVGVIIM